ncbi:MAG TPA: hypothetical protein VG406_23220 [Isosphaeraceae bacterium]|jgi:hypothetical protein|nr:hypothetical protein [Isosphaeraceae bacterium]
MTRRPQNRFVPRHLALEGRELLSVATPHPHAAQLHQAQVSAHRPPHFEIRLASPAATSLSLRLNLSQQITARVNQSFQAFLYNYLGQSITIPGSNEVLPNRSGAAAGTSAGTGSGANQGGAGSGGGGFNGGGNGIGTPSNISGGTGTMPASPATPVGTIPDPPTLPNFIAQVETQVDDALRTFQINNNRPQPSIQASIRVSPLADLALVPFANQQLAQMEATIAAHPPQFAADGTITNPQPLAAVKSAYTAILNAIAEFSVHPTLFTSPSDFYINSTANFPLTFTGTPANTGSGFFVRGPGGAPLVGARR